MVKDPSKFRISNTLNDKVKAGEFYCSIAAAYFYMPLEYAMNPEEKTTTNTVGLPASVGKVEIDGEPSSKHFERNKDYFLLARYRGALGLF